MINLLAITYNNIWPFKDKTLSIFFNAGKYLIKAPIGTGKSFLFFDWPVYGLYKYSTRNMLNNQSKEWFIKILFECDNEKYFVVRKISKAKTKESCSSQLRKINADNIDLWVQEIVNYDTDIQDIIKKSNLNLEEIIFKNETDLQQTLQTILPPREVFVNTVFLMQDSDNIFELIPSERLTVLKNVFWLLGIDEAKDTITEKRKEVSYRLKAYKDTSKYDEKIKSLVHWYTSSHIQLQEYKSQILWSGNNQSDNEKDQSSIQELIAIQDKIAINDLNIDSFSSNIDSEINTIIIDKKDVYQKSKNQIDNLQNQQKDIQKDIDYKRQEIINISKTNDELTKKLSQTDPVILENLKKEKKQLQLSQENIDQEIQKHQKMIKDFSDTDINIVSIYQLIQDQKNKWLKLKEELQNINLKIKNEELQQKHEIELLNNQIKNNTEKYDQQNLQLQELQKVIEQFDKNLESQATYECEKIGTNCPFIKVINKKTFDQLQLQKDSFIEQEKKIITQIESIKIIITENKKILEGKNKQGETSKIIQEHKNNIINIENQISLIKNFLTAIDWENIEDLYNQNTQNQQKINKLDKEISIQEALHKEIENIKQQKEKNDTIITTLQENILALSDKSESLKKLILEQEESLKSVDYQMIINTEKAYNIFKNTQRDIQILIWDYKTIKLQTNQLEIEEKQLNNLYTIFSKELLLLVLQDHLPMLNDIINNQLSQVVNYTINLSLNKTNADKLELDAFIIDELGQREIKSLSWWQKIILKLIWMLAISAYTNSPILFLDETINNLDNDTISNVTEMLENFIKQRNLKLYTVTHNQQIQDMNIRDKIIEIYR